MATQTNQATSESIAKSNAALARLMATVPAPAAAPITTDKQAKLAAKAVRLAEQEKVMAVTDPKVTKPVVVKTKKATKASALSKQGDTAKNVAKEIAALGAAATTEVKAANARIAKKAAATKPTLNPSVEAVSAGVARLAKDKKAATKQGATAAAQAVATVLKAQAAAVVPAKKPNVKVAILDLFYSNLDLQLTTMETVLTLQHLHAGMNESSIRVWLTDLRKDGTLVKVEERDGKDVLTAGTPGEQWGLRGTTSSFALAHKDRKPPVKAAAKIDKGSAIPASLQAAILDATRAFDKMMGEFKRFGKA